MSRHTALFGSMRIGNIDGHTWESKAEQHKAMSTRIEAWYNRTRDVLRSGISPRDRVRFPSRRGVINAKIPCGEREAVGGTVESTV